MLVALMIGHHVSLTLLCTAASASHGNPDKPIARPDKCIAATNLSRGGARTTRSSARPGHHRTHSHQQDGEVVMIRKFKTAIAALLIAAAAVPFVPATSNAGPYDGGAYWHRHDDKGW
jgi:hypothetical protein